VLLAGDGDDDLVQVPFVAEARSSATNTIGEPIAEDTYGWISCGAGGLRRAGSG
jgi:hypothetical protein